MQEDVLTPELVTQRLNQPIGRVDRPLLAELQHGLGVAAGVLEGDRASAAMAGNQLAQPLQPVALERFVCHLQAQALGQLGARILHGHHLLHPQAQATGEIVIADLAFDHHHGIGLQQGLCRHEGIGKQRRLDAPGAVVQGDEAHLVALLVLHHPQGNDHAGDGLGFA
ncbi:hypothetical protein D3C78_1108240 [compost metagenome]